MLYAQQPPLPADGSFSAQDHVQYLAEITARLTLGQAWADSGRFRAVTGNIPQFGMGQPPAWFRSRVANPTG